MNREDLSNIVTVKDLEELRINLIEEFKDIVNKKSSQKEFLSPKEFQHLTGIPYSTVVNKCTNGKLKARQEEPKGSWLIDASEVERYKREAAENI